MAHLGSPLWEREAEYGGLSLDPSPGGRRIEDHEEPRNGSRRHLEPLADNPLTQPHLGVESAQRLLNGRQLGLHLDDDRHTGSALNSQQVDRAALSELRERDLGGYLPAQRLELPADLADQRSVPFVEQAVECPGAPSHFSLERGVERGEHLPHGPNREAFPMAALDQ